MKETQDNNDLHIIAMGSDGMPMELDPTVEAIMSILVRAQKQIAKEEIGWIEIHWQGSKVFARLKKHIGLQKYDPALNVETE